MVFTKNRISHGIGSIGNIFTRELREEFRHSEFSSFFFFLEMIENLKTIGWENLIIQSNCFLDQGSFAMIIKAKWKKFHHFNEMNSPVVAIKLITQTLSFAQRKDYQQEKDILFQEAKLLQRCKEYSVRNVIDIYGIVEGKLSESASKLIPSSREGDDAVGIMLEYFESKTLFRLLLSPSSSSSSSHTTASSASPTA